MKWLVLLSLIGLAASTAHYESLEEWNLWKARHGRSYNNLRVDLERHLVWLSNKKYIEQHNANAHIFGFNLAMNHFGDMTDDEFKSKYLTYKKSEGNYTGVKVFRADPWMDYPNSIDWRTKNAVTGVKDQGQCGASYAFSAIGSLEGAWALATNNLVSLSEQNIIDCSVTSGNRGCNGGNMYDAFRYVIANNGVDKSSYYPFQGKQTSCTYNKSYRGATMSGIIKVASDDETSLMAAIATTGPVSVAVDSNSNAFRFYYSGVYDSSVCTSYDLDHGMVITGYGTYGSTEYWLVKNSWGTNWGMNGYILMSRNKFNQCGIASDASYPTL